MVMDDLIGENMSMNMAQRPKIQAIKLLTQL